VGGTTVAASIAGIQRSPKVYPDPLRFWPERFLEQPAPYTLIPFGGGERRCIGASFAIMEIKTVLRTVLQRVDLHVPNVRDERPSRTRSVGIVARSRHTSNRHGTTQARTGQSRFSRISFARDHWLGATTR
jgi:cytochrome P450